MNTVPLHHYVSSGGFASLCAFYVNELSSPMDVKHADVQLHLRKFLLSPNMFLSIAVCRIAASKDNQVLGMIRRNITYNDTSLIIPLYKAIHVVRILYTGMESVS